MDRHGVIRQCVRRMPVEKAAWNPFNWFYGAKPGLQPDVAPKQFATEAHPTGFMDPVGPDGKPQQPNVMGSNSTMSKDPVTGWPVRTTTTVTQQGQVRAPMTKDQYAEYQRQLQLNRYADNLNTQINDLIAKHQGMRKQLDSAPAIPNAPAFKSTAPAGYQVHIDKLQAAEKQIAELQEKMKGMQQAPPESSNDNTAAVDNLRMQGYSSDGANMMQQLQKVSKPAPTATAPTAPAPSGPASTGGDGFDLPGLGKPLGPTPAPRMPAPPKPAGMPSLGPRGAPGPRKLWTVS